MTVTLVRSLPNVMTSVFRFLKDTPYVISAVTATLTGHFSGLQVVQGYPDDLTKLSAPTLALALDTIRQGQDFFGQAIGEDLYPLNLFGFVVGQGTDLKNKRYRDRLLSDVYQLLTVVAQNEGMPLYDSETKADIGNLEVSSASGRLLPVNAPEIEGDRFKFLVDFDIDFVS